MFHSSKSGTIGSLNLGKIAVSPDCNIQIGWMNGIEKPRLHLWHWFAFHSQLTFNSQHFLVAQCFIGHPVFWFCKPILAFLSIILLLVKQGVKTCQGGFNQFIVNYIQLDHFRIILFSIHEHFACRRATCTKDTHFFKNVKQENRLSEPIFYFPLQFGKWR